MEGNETVKDSKINAFTLFDAILVFFKYKKYIYVSTAVVFVVSIILYFLVFDLIYMSSATIKSSSKGSGLLGALEGSIPDIGGLDDFGLGSGKSAKELASYEEILMSRKCLEPLIIKFGLMERDDYRFMEDALKNFRTEKLKIGTEKLAGVMSISVYDKDKVLAKEMVDYLLAELDRINIELNVTNAKNNREFIEARYLQSREDLRRSEDSLKSFQEIYGIAPDLQIKAAAQSVFLLESELKAEEVKLDVLKKLLGAQQPEVKVQEAKIQSLSTKIQEINTSTDLNDFLRLGNSPNIAIAFLRLQRELEIQTKILTFMLPLYEQAKIEEKRETPTILILDSPVVAEKKTKPKRLTMVLALTLFGFVLSSLVFLVFDRVKRFKIQLNAIQK